MMTTCVKNLRWMIGIWAVGLGLTACTQEELPAIIYCYEETQCSDPWGNSSNLDLDNTALVIEDYLTEQDIKVLSVSITPAPRDFAACEACHCPSGNVIEVSLKRAEDADRLLKMEGFAEDSWKACE